MRNSSKRARLRLVAAGALLALSALGLAGAFAASRGEEAEAVLSIQGMT